MAKSTASAGGGSADRADRSGEGDDAMIHDGGLSSAQPAKTAARAHGYRTVRMTSAVARVKQRER